MEEDRREKSLSKLIQYCAIVFFAVATLTLLESCKNDDNVTIDEDLEDTTDTIDQLPGDSSDTAAYYPYCVEEPIDSLEQDGCHDIFLVKKLDTIDRQAVAITLDSALARVGRQCQTFILPSEGISVELLTAGNHQDSIYLYFCEGTINEFVAEPYHDPLVSGTLVIGADTDPEKMDSTEFLVSARLDNATFKSERIDTTINRIIFYKIALGWEPK